MDLQGGPISLGSVGVDGDSGHSSVHAEHVVMVLDFYKSAVTSGSFGEEELQGISNAAQDLCAAVSLAPAPTTSRPQEATRLLYEARDKMKEALALMREAEVEALADTLVLELWALGRDINTQNKGRP